ncbi:hypothetical protein Hanom_Chr16g01462931 [Helianthus anomalus]
MDDDNDIVEGEYVHNYTKEELARLCIIDEDEFVFDFEEELLDTENDEKHEAYVLKPVAEANDYDEVEIEDDFDDVEVRYANYQNEKLPTFT